ncbi:MAG: hypothetical protein Q9221_003438 [Calogaya cf. arnoldii]
MELDMYLDNTHFDEQRESTIIKDILTRLATKHNAHAYNQCPECLSASQAPLPGPLTRTQPVPHPSSCKACKTSLKTELDTVEQQLRNLNASLNFQNQAPFTPIGHGAELLPKFEFLMERRKVLKEQLREPCSFSIPLPPHLVFKQPQYQALQVDRLDPRYHPHQHQGTICNFGGKVGSAQWEAAQYVLRNGWDVMPHLRQQKKLVKLLWDREQQLGEEREKEQEKRREKQLKRQSGSGAR